MSDLNKYQGVIPAFYACYDDEGNISPERVRGLTRHLISKGVNGLYMGGSSGECIYQSVAERKVVLENVMAGGQGKVVVIAHVACNNTADSQGWLPMPRAWAWTPSPPSRPSTSTCPEYGIAQVLERYLRRCPNTDFIIYNIPSWPVWL